MNNTDRLKYYLGEMYNLERAVVTEPYQDFEKDSSFNPTNNVSRMNYKTLQHENVLKIYSQLLGHLLQKGKYETKSFLYCIGDIEKQLNTFCLAKNRSGVDKKPVLLKCPNQHRHWDLVYNKSNFSDIPYDKKANKLVWRGVTTGQPNRPGNRFTLVEKFFKKTPEIDVGFNGICQGKDKYEKYKVDGMCVTDLLKYKYVLMVEGNDKASGLNWALASNSLVFMAKPTKFSWLMEDKLIPNVHYILVKNDFSDLLEKVQWCNKNPEKCKQIVKKANEYMKSFMNLKNEEWLQLEVLKHYFSKLVLL